MVFVDLDSCVLVEFMTVWLQYVSFCFHSQYSPTQIQADYHIYTYTAVVSMNP